MKLNKKMLITLSSIVLCVALVLSVSSIASAEEVVVEEYKNTALTFVDIQGNPSDADSVWPTTSSYKEDIAKASYKITSNSFAPWFNEDCVSYAYQTMDFAYGKNGTLTVETQLNSWNATMSPEAGAGLMLRTSTKPGAVNLMFHCRPTRIMVTYRAVENLGSTRGKTVSAEIQYPVKFKIVLNNNKAVCYLKQATDKDYTTFATIPFVCGNTVLAGLAAYSQNKDDHATADFTGFHSFITTPEGAERVEGDEGDTSSDTTSSEEEIKLPEDPAVQDNVLMRETFTSGTLTHEEESYPSAVNWRYNSMYQPGIVTNEDNTNRYIYDWMENDRYYYGGDQHWSDYTMTMDLTFTMEYSDEATNRLDVFVRHTDIAQYGVHDYGVSFNMSGGRQYISIVKRSGGVFNAQASKVTLPDAAGNSVNVEVQQNYLPETAADVKACELKIKAFDNTITVWYDGKQILSYTDTSSDIKGFGSVGWLATDAAVMIDNVEVIGETDLLGGDYDNTLCGNWDKPIPELIQQYAENGWEY